MKKRMQNAECRMQNYGVLQSPDKAPSFWISQQGFTLIEAIVGIAVFTLIALGIYSVVTQTIKLIHAARARVAATALANEQIEIIRNLPYAQVGTASGIPPGSLPQTQTLVRDGISFTVNTTIRNIDDPFDGTAGGTPNDTAPADYKLVEVTVSCSSCAGNPPLVFTTTVAPKNLEVSTTNGSLFIRAFDASGHAVPQASVYVENTTVSPPIAINDVTNNEGLLQLIDVPPANESYAINVTKNGYSTERTYLPGAPENPNPVKPHASVLTQQVTQVSFSIDKLSTVLLTTTNQLCTPLTFINMHGAGTKLIGTDPSLLKYSEDFFTDGNGARTLTNLEWDTYTFTLTDTAYDLAGSIPLLPLLLPPDTILPLTFILKDHTPYSLLVSVLDSATQQPLSESQIHLSRSGYDNTLITNRGYVWQTDWSGGGGQEQFIDETRYAHTNGGIDATTTPGDLLLFREGSSYQSTGELISSTIDTGPGTNYVAVFWKPTDQDPRTGSDSVHMQLASNNDTTTWNFIGPDGTASSFYTPGSSSVHASHNNNRYIRYKIFLSTLDQALSPNVSDIGITFVNGCVPPGQAFFSNLTANEYTLEVSHEGYATSTDNVSITGNNSYSVILTP
ncbi:MAG: prepilin-type N-terminal cleavage/methylation domain-containing protein [Patescibacteria group bacterium]